jgi:large subunit ribosomal protein L15
MNELSNLKPPAGAVKARKRVGRGLGSGLGKTCGKGQKGHKSRSGGKTPRGFEGGQMPLHRRLPKRGFSNFGHRLDYMAINVSRLERFEDGATVDLDALKRLGMAKGHDIRVKITGMGELSKKLIIKASRVSEAGKSPERSKTERRNEFLVVTKGAADKIIAAGGAVEVG